MKYLYLLVALSLSFAQVSQMMYLAEHPPPVNQVIQGHATTLPASGVKYDVTTCHMNERLKQSDHYQQESERSYLNDLKEEHKAFWSKKGQCPRHRILDPTTDHVKLDLGMNSAILSTHSILDEYIQISKYVMDHVSDLEKGYDYILKPDGGSWKLEKTQKRDSSDETVEIYLDRDHETPFPKGGASWFSTSNFGKLPPGYWSNLKDSLIQRLSGIYSDFFNHESESKNLEHE